MAVSKKGARKSGPPIRNANRRLGDRLWSAEGEEYAREMTPEYYLSGPQVASTISSQSPRVALLRDNSPLEWPDPRSLKKLINNVAADGSIVVDGRPFRPTLWTAVDRKWLVLFEEVH